MWMAERQSGSSEMGWNQRPEGENKVFLLLWLRTRRCQWHLGVSGSSVGTGSSSHRCLSLVQEEAKTFITPENLEARIEECLDNPRNYNFAIDKDGRIVKRTVLS